MKRKFSFIAALIASVMLVAISCSNASNITFTDGSKGGNFTEDGLSRVTISLGALPSYKAIYPDEWGEDKLQNLNFVLKGTSQSEVPVKGDLLKGEGFAFAYTDLKKGAVTIDLDPVEWTLSLEAYTELEHKNKVLEAINVPANLTAGGKEVTFNLSSPAAGGTTGKVAITVNFPQKPGALATKAILDIVEEGSLTTSVITQGVTTESGSFGEGGDARKTIQLIKEGIPAGDYYFKATFYDNTEIICQHIEHLRIDSGNTSSKTISIPEGSFNSKPVPPEEFTATCKFAPADSGKVTLQDGTLAQDVASVSQSNYNITFTWKDKSYNEEQFELKFNADSTPVTVNKKSVEDSLKSPGAVSLAGNVVVTDLNGGTDGTANGNMGPDCNSITLSVPTGVQITEVSLIAKNSLGDSSPVKIDTATTPLGMFTVSYKLDGVGSSLDNAVVTYNVGSSTKNKYFVQAFNFGAKDGFITTKSMPSISHKNFEFKGWQILDSDGNKKDVATIEDLKSKLQESKEHKNVELTGAWLGKATIKVSYPSYNDYRNLDVVTDTSIGNAIEPGPDGNVVLTIPTVSIEKAVISDVKFIIYKPGVDAKPIATYSTDAGADGNGVEITNSQKNTGGATFTWNTKTFTGVDAVYPVYVSYKYAKKTGITTGTPTTVDGTLYVKIANSVTQ